MSKRHEANRRRAYGRRQHEMHQRTERPDRFLGWVEVNLTDRAADRITPDRQIHSNAGDWILSTGMD
jgi:hypothetical protein